jgi:hypothetical protein
MNPLMPMNEAVLIASLSLFTKVSVIMTGLVALLFTMRMVFLSLKASGSFEYGAVIGDTVRYLGLTVLFPTFIRLILDITAGLALKVSYVPLTAAQKQIELFSSQMFGEFVIFQVIGKVGDIFLMMLSQSFYTVLMALLLSIAPVMIFFSTMLGLSQGVGAYFMMFISFSMWPVLWNLLGLLGRELWPLLGNSPVSVVTFWIVIQVLQVLSPIVSVILFMSLSPSQALSKIVSFVR